MTSEQDWRHLILEASAAVEMAAGRWAKAVELADAARHTVKQAESEWKAEVAHLQEVIGDMREGQSRIEFKSAASGSGEVSA